MDAHNQLKQSFASQVSALVVGQLVEQGRLQLFRRKSRRRQQDAGRRAGPAGPTTGRPGLAKPTGSEESGWKAAGAAAPLSPEPGDRAKPAGRRFAGKSGGKPKDGLRPKGENPPAKGEPVQPAQSLSRETDALRRQRARPGLGSPAVLSFPEHGDSRGNAEKGAE